MTRPRRDVPLRHPIVGLHRTRDDHGRTVRTVDDIPAAVLLVADRVSVRVVIVRGTVQDLTFRCERHRSGDWDDSVLQKLNRCCVPCPLSRNEVRVDRTAPQSRISVLRAMAPEPMLWAGARLLR